jgi:alpha-amylase
VAKRAHDYFQDLYAMFRSLNAARRAAIASHPPYLSTLLRAHQLNNHSLALTKPPLLSVLTNYGSSIPATVLYIPPTQTGYKPLLPVIDVLTEQILATDPHGGLTVPIIAGQPRVFLPLAVHKNLATKEAWLGITPVKIDTSVVTGQGEGKTPVTPGAAHRRTPSLGHRVLSWLGHAKSP